MTETSLSMPLKQRPGDVGRGDTVQNGKLMSERTGILWTLSNTKKKRERKSRIRQQYTTSKLRIVSGHAAPVCPLCRYRRHTRPRPRFAVSIVFFPELWRCASSRTITQGWKVRQSPVISLVIASPLSDQGVHAQATDNRLLGSQLIHYHRERFMS